MANYEKFNLNFFFKKIEGERDIVGTPFHVYGDSKGNIDAG